MYSDIVTFCALAAYLPAVLCLHAIWYRVDTGLQKLPAQGPALKAAGAGALLVAVALLLLLPRDSEFLSHMLFAAIGLMGLATFYFTFLCVSESGRRYFLLTLLNRTPTPLSRDELATLYGKDYMIDVRLGRLLTWGVVTEANGQIVLRKYSFYLTSYVFYLWSLVLDYRWFARAK